MAKGEGYKTAREGPTGRLACAAEVSVAQWWTVGQLREKEQVKQNNFHTVHLLQEAAVNL